MGEHLRKLEHLSPRRLSRRDFVRATALTVSSTAIGGFLAACGGSSTPAAPGTASSGSTASTSSTGSSGTTASGTAAAGTSAQGTASAGAAVGSGKAGGTVTFGAWQTPDTMDPQKTGLAATSRILFQAMDPLVWKFPGDDSFYPGLAEKWEISSDGKSYTFTLRQGIKFHNGEPFNAAAVKWTFDRMADKAQQTLATLPQYDHTDAASDTTATIVFTDIYGPFLGLLSASVAYMPIPPNQSKNNPDQFGLTPAGTGPFVIKEYVPNNHATLVRNADYNWAPQGYFKRTGGAYLDQINWRIIAEPATRVATLQSGEIDMAEDVAPALVAQVENDKRFQMIYHDTLGCPHTVCLNCEKAPTDDKLVRQALSYAVNKQTVTDTVFKKTQKIAYGPIEVLTPGYNPEVEKYYHFDANKAKQLLDQAGWKVNASTGVREKNGQPLKMLFIVIANDNFDETAQVIQSNFKDVGIDLQLQTESEPTVFDTYNRGDQHLAEIFWWGTDPQSLYSLYHSSNIAKGFNWSHYKNPDVDKLLEQGQQVNNLSDRIPFYMKAQIGIMDDAASIPIWGKRVMIGAKKSVQGMNWSQNVYPIFYNTTVQ